MRAEIYHDIMENSHDLQATPQPRKPLQLSRKFGTDLSSSSVGNNRGSISPSSAKRIAATTQTTSKERSKSSSRRQQKAPTSVNKRDDLNDGGRLSSTKKEPVDYLGAPNNNAISHSPARLRRNLEMEGTLRRVSSDGYYTSKVKEEESCKNPHHVLRDGSLGFREVPVPESRDGLARQNENAKLTPNRIISMSPGSAASSKILGKSLIKSPKNTEFEVTFQPGPLCLKVEPVIKSSGRELGCRLKQSLQGDPGTILPQIQHCPASKPGDIILAIDGVEVMSKSYSDILVILGQPVSSGDRIILFRSAKESSKRSTSRQGHSSQKCPDQSESMPNIEKSSSKARIKVEGKTVKNTPRSSSDSKDSLSHHVHLNFQHLSERDSLMGFNDSCNVDISSPKCRSLNLSLTPKSNAIECTPMPRKDHFTSHDISSLRDCNGMFSPANVKMLVEASSFKNAIIYTPMRAPRTLSRVLSTVVKSVAPKAKDVMTSSLAMTSSVTEKLGQVLFGHSSRDFEIAIQMKTELLKELSQARVAIGADEEARDHLQRTIEDLSESNASHRRARETAEQELKLARQESAQVKLLQSEKIDQLESLSKLYQNELVEAHQTIKKTGCRADKLEAQNEALHAHIEKLRVTHDTKGSVLSAIQDELDEQRNTASVLRNGVDQLTTQLRDKEKLLHVVKQELVMRTTKVAELVSNLEASKITATNLCRAETRISELEADISRLIAEQKTISIQNKDNEDRLLVVQKELEMTKENAAKFHEEADKREQNIREHVKNLEKKSESSSLNQQTIERLRIELSNTLRKNDEISNVLHDAETSKESLMKQLRTVQEQLVCAEGQVCVYNSTTDEIHEKWSILNTKHETLEATNLSIMEKNQELTTKILEITELSDESVRESQQESLMRSQESDAYRVQLEELEAMMLRKENEFAEKFHQLEDRLYETEKKAKSERESDESVIDALRAELSGVRQSVKRAEQPGNASYAVLHEILEQVDSSPNGSGTIKTQISNLEAENDSYSMEVSMVNSHLDAQLSEMESDQNTVRLLTAENAQLENALEEAVAAQQERTNEQRLLKDNFEEVRASLEIQLTNLSDDLSSMKEREEEASRQHHSDMGQIISSRKGLEIMHESCMKQKDADIEALNERIECLSLHLTEKEPEMKLVTDTYKTQIDDLEKHNHTLLSGQEGKGIRMQLLVEENQQLKTAKEEALKSRNTQVNALESEIETLKDHTKNLDIILQQNSRDHEQILLSNEKLIDELNTHLTNTERKENASLKDQALIDLTERIKVFAEASLSATARITSLSEEKDTLVGKLARAEAEISSRKELEIMHESSMKQKDADIEALNERIECLSLHLAEKESEMKLVTDTYKTQIDDLEKHNHTLLSGQEGKGIRMQLLVEENQQLKTAKEEALKSCKMQVNALESEIETLKDHTKNLDIILQQNSRDHEQILFSNEKLIDELKTHLTNTELEENVSLKDQALIDLTERINVFEDASLSATARITSLSEEKDTLVGKLALAEVEAKDKEEDIEVLKKTVQRLSSELTEKIAEIKVLSESHRLKVEELEKEKGTIVLSQEGKGIRIQLLTEENRKLKSAKEELLSNETKRSSSLESEIEKLTKHAQVLDSALEQKLKEQEESILIQERIVTNLNQEMGQVKVEASKLKEQLFEATARFRDLELRFKDTRQENLILVNEVETIRSSKQTEIDEMISKIDSFEQYFNSEYSLMKVEKEKWSKTVAERTEELSVLNTRISYLEASRISQQNEHENALNRANEKIKRLDNDVIASQAGEYEALQLVDRGIDTLGHKEHEITQLQEKLMLSSKKCEAQNMEEESIVCRLEATVRQLEDEVMKKSVAICSFEQEIEEQKLLMDVVKSDFKTKYMIIHEAYAEIEAKLSASFYENSEIRGSSQMLEDELESLRIKSVLHIKDNSCILAQLSKVKRELSESLTSYDESFITLSARESALRSKLCEIGSQYTVKCQENEMKSKSIELHLSNVEELEKELLALRSAAHSMTEKVAENEETCRLKTVEVHRLRLEIDDKCAILVNQKDFITDLEAQVAGKTQEIEERHFREQMLELDSVGTKLTNKASLEILSRDCAFWKDSVAKVESVALANRSFADKQTKELVASMEKINKMKHQVNQLQSCRLELEAAYNEADQRASYLKKSNESYNLMFKDLEDQLHKKESTVTMLEDQLSVQECNLRKIKLALLETEQKEQLQHKSVHEYAEVLTNLKSDSMVEPLKEGSGFRNKHDLSQPSEKQESKWNERTDDMPLESRLSRSGVLSPESRSCLNIKHNHSLEDFQQIKAMVNQAFTPVKATVNELFTSSSDEQVEVVSSLEVQMSCLLDHLKVAKDAVDETEEFLERVEGIISDHEKARKDLNHIVSSMAIYIKDIEASLSEALSCRKETEAELGMLQKTLENTKATEVASMENAQSIVASSAQVKASGAIIIKQVLDSKAKQLIGTSFRQWACRTSASQAVSKQMSVALEMMTELQTTREKLMVLKSHYGNGTFTTMPTPIAIETYRGNIDPTARAAEERNILDRANTAKSNETNVSFWDFSDDETE